MTPRFPAAKNLAAKLAALLAAAAVVVVGLGATQADAAKQKAREGVAYSSRGPNVSYQSGPRTRVYISKRSWLDAGVEVMPGDRKFTDYAYPPNQSFGRENLNRPLDRQPLNSSWDLGGYPERFPLY